MHRLATTKAKVVITTRIFPEDLRVVAVDYPFGPMSEERSDMKFFCSRRNLFNGRALSGCV